MIRPHYVGVFQSICSSEKMADLSGDTSRLFFLQILTHCDSYGRSQASPASLNALVWPLLGKSVAQTAKALADLERVGLVRQYAVGGKLYLQVVQWEQFAGKVGRPEKRGKGVWPEPPPGLLPTSPENGGPVAPRAHLGSDRIGSDGEESEEGAKPSKPTPADEAFAANHTLDTPAVRVAWTAWEAHRREIKHPLTSETIRATFRRYAGKPGPFVTAIEHTIRMGWQGLRDPDPEDIARASPAASNGKYETSDEADVRSRWMRKHTRKIPNPTGMPGTVEVTDPYPGLTAARAELEARIA